MQGAGAGTDSSDPAVYRDIFGKKRQKNIVDFTDMEHFALEILVKKKTERSGIPRRRMNFPIGLRKS